MNDIDEAVSPALIPTTRKAAREIGAVRYNTGKPCARGHLADRYTKSSICVQCSKESQQARRNKTPGKEANRLSQRELRQNVFYKAELLEASRRHQVPAAQIPPHYDKFECRAVYLDAVIKTRDTGVPHEVDHIIPLSGGGFHSAENLQVLTRAENAKKRLTDWLVYGYPRGGRKKKNPEGGSEA